MPLHGEILQQLAKRIRNSLPKVDLGLCIRTLIRVHNVSNYA